MRRVLYPSSIAVIGASRSPDRVGHNVLANILGAGFTGPVYAVNPEADEVLALFAGHNLRAVLNGHFHGNQEEVVDGVLFTTTACLSSTRGNHDGTDLKGYRLFHCAGGEITTEFVAVEP